MRKPERKQFLYVSPVENNESKALNLGLAVKLLQCWWKALHFFPFLLKLPDPNKRGHRNAELALPCTVCTKNLLKPVWYWLPPSPSPVPGAWLSCNSGVSLLVLGWMGWAEGWEAPDSLGETWLNSSDPLRAPGKVSGWWLYKAVVSRGGLSDSEYPLCQIPYEKREDREDGAHLEKKIYF